MLKSDRNHGDDYVTCVVLDLVSCFRLLRKGFMRFVSHFFSCRDTAWRTSNLAPETTVSSTVTVRSDAQSAAWSVLLFERDGRPTRPPSQSLNSYGTADDVRSPTGSAGTPGPMPQQPSSQQSTDNNSEAEVSGSAAAFCSCHRPVRCSLKPPASRFRSGASGAR
ncbi:hypothetical protein HPB49_000054 [Dermacentor silvarum]|uniref:Uncharacterized protein n=1 Tax=Dermacentor silvarum TaxID=543639 RepID=A0ACB8CCF2_DERSI|nr:hypothetical protein HPB49_000054 [Dermacentor silvarum]